MSLYLIVIESTQLATPRRNGKSHMKFTPEAGRYDTYVMFRINTSDHWENIKNTRNMFTKRPAGSVTWRHTLLYKPYTNQTPLLFSHIQSLSPSNNSPHKPYTQQAIENNHTQCPTTNQSLSASSPKPLFSSILPRTTRSQLRSCRNATVCSVLYLPERLRTLKI